MGQVSFYRLKSTPNEKKNSKRLLIERYLTHTVWAIPEFGYGAACIMRGLKKLKIEKLRKFKDCVG